MIETLITKLLDIKYPIIQGGMIPVSDAELAAAVSDAGGFGIIASAVFSSGEELRTEIVKAKNFTDKPFGVNISLFPSVRPLPNDEFIKVCIDESVSAVETSGVRSPEEFVEPLRDGKVKLIHKVAEVRHAIKAEEIGADAVTVVGVESGGHPGHNDLTSMILVPLTVDAVQIPVLAGGGITDSRSFVAALSLGADGVVIGTRFMATKESNIHPKFKEWMINAKESDTTIVMRALKMNTRAMKNETTEKILHKERMLKQRNATFEEILAELLPLIKGEKTKKVFKNGDLNAGVAPCGQTIGSINKILTVKKVIEDIIKGSDSVIKRLNLITTQN
ncbi:MAG: nitronate monooxygenase [Candidatus Bathyarchaeota archaeon]